MSGRLWVAATLAACGLAGCGGDGGGESTQAPARPKAAALRVAWTAQPGPLWDAGPDTTSAWAWPTRTSLIVAEQQALTSYALSDGAKEWTVRLPRAVCAIADTPNDKGVGAVLLSGGTEVDPESCGAVSTVDVDQGKLLWTRSLRGLSSYGMTGVQIGPEAVAVTNPCDRAVTFAVRDGERLASWPDRDEEGCRHSYASDGTVVVDGEDRGRDGAFVGYDAVSGQRRWTAAVQASVAGRSARPEADRVISGSPLVLDGSANSHRFLFRIDPEAGRATPFGREADDSFVPVFTRRIGDRIAVQYGESPVLFTYDPTSGDAVGRAVLGWDGSAFGVRDGSVMSLAASGDSALRDAGLSVLQTDLANGTQQVVGTGKLDGVAATFGRGTGFDAVNSGGTMILRTDGGLAAYRLPSRGPAASALAAGPRLGAGELPGEKGIDLCTGISQATKRALGFTDPALAAPANCHWVEPVDDGGIRQLHVTTLALEPAAGVSATDRARRNVARLRRADAVNHVPALTPLSDVGDEAAAGTGQADTRLARVVARLANVVIVVNVVGSDATPRAAELRRAERGARLAAADLVAEAERRR